MEVGDSVAGGIPVVGDNDGIFVGLWLDGSIAERREVLLVLEGDLEGKGDGAHERTAAV